MENKKIEDLTAQLLKEIGEDPSREGLLRTPARVSKAWQFFAKGYNQDLEKIINNAIFNEDAKDMVIVRDIEFFSLCEHHLIPFFGRAHVGYLPNGKVVGLSKIPRIIDMFSRRLQVQERLTQQILVALQTLLDTRDVAVFIDATHYCVKARGIMDVSSRTETSALGGLFKSDQSLRDNFLNNQRR